MNFRYLILLMLFCLNTVWADFSDARFRLHPIQPAFGGAYLIEITGEWPSDCHPGEQKPVIRDYTGDSALVEFETIVVHVTCNDVPTPYRVLIDMSDVIDSVAGTFAGIEVTLRFDGIEFTKLVELLCICSPAPIGPDIKPEPGLYSNEELDKQGLILARQNHRMGVYPLIYDESGSSEWLFGGSGIVEDVFFTDLVELTGGQCLGCQPPEEPTVMNTVGKLTMLMDSEGLIQVKVNDGLFIPYQPLVFGYGDFQIVDVSENTGVKIPDLSGRWALSDDKNNLWGEVTPPPTSILPLVFDIMLRSNIDPPLPVVTEPPAANVFYALINIEGELVAEMDCRYSDEMVCELRIPEFINFNESYEVRALSPQRVFMKNMAPNDPDGGVGVGTGIAVRID